MEILIRRLDEFTNSPPGETRILRIVQFRITKDFASLYQLRMV